MELCCGTNVTAGYAHGNKTEDFVPNSSAVAQYLPFLRRYARALTGNQASGDAYVAATLEAVARK
jgi:DNA-directed RNA polymerase specialized sigma24 family protein